MITAISWKQYLEGIAGLGIVYYAGVVLLYYKQELKGLFVQKQLPEKGILGIHSAASEPLDRRLMSEVHDLMQEINMAFKEAEKNKYIDKELFYALQLVLRKYRDIQSTHFGISINNYISDTAASHCSISFTEDDLNALWKD
jgi:hypothetical protein